MMEGERGWQRERARERERGEERRGEEERGSYIVLSQYFGTGIDCISRVVLLLGYYVLLLKRN